MKDNHMVQSNNEFVKREQAKMKGMMGNRPTVPKKMEEFNAFMSNNEMTSKDMASKIGRTMDDAFPVK